MDAPFDKRPVRVAVSGRNLDDLMPLLKPFPVAIVEEKPDLVISHGGDGCLLGAERQFPGVPKCPIRDHRQNPKCPKHAETSTLQRLFDGQLKKTRLIKLKAAANKQNLLGINDIVITKTQAQSAIRYRIWVNDELLCPQVVADSLVIATPFGSTGYFQSITRGHLLCGLGLAFNNAMDLSNFSVLPEASVITVQLLRGPAIMIADNDPTQISLHQDDTATIRVVPEMTDIYGIDVFRCPDCYHLRQNGLT